MTDRVHSITIALEKDIRTDDIEPLIEAIKMFRGVVAVEQNITDSGVWLAEQRAKHDMREKFFQFYKSLGE